jgi:hypothetical protein
MPINKKDQQELDQFHSEDSRKYKGLKEDYFALRYLVKGWPGGRSEAARKPRRCHEWPPYERRDRKHLSGDWNVIS